MTEKQVLASVCAECGKRKPLLQRHVEDAEARAEEAEAEVRRLRAKVAELERWRPKR